MSAGSRQFACGSIGAGRSPTDGSRLYAAAPLTLDDVKDATGEGVATRARSRTGRDAARRSISPSKHLIALQDAKVPGSVIDLMVALSYPDRFVVERRRADAIARAMPFIDDPFFLGWAFGYPMWSDYGFYSPLYGPYSPYFYSPFLSVSAVVQPCTPTTAAADFVVIGGGWRRVVVSNRADVGRSLMVSGTRAFARAKRSHAPGKRVGGSSRESSSGGIVIIVMRQAVAAAAARRAQWLLERWRRRRRRPQRPTALRFPDVMTDLSESRWSGALRLIVVRMARDVARRSLDCAAADGSSNQPRTGVDGQSEGRARRRACAPRPECVNPKIPAAECNVGATPINGRTRRWATVRSSSSLRSRTSQSARRRHGASAPAVVDRVPARRQDPRHRARRPAPHHPTTACSTRPRLPARPQVHAAGLQGLMDVVLHPRFAENHYVYLAYHKPVPFPDAPPTARHAGDGWRDDAGTRTFGTARRSPTSATSSHPARHAPSRRASDSGATACST